MADSTEANLLETEMNLVYEHYVMLRSVGEMSPSRSLVVARATQTPGTATKKKGLVSADWEGNY